MLRYFFKSRMKTYRMVVEAAQSYLNLVIAPGCSIVVNNVNYTTSQIVSVPAGDVDIWIYTGSSSGTFQIEHTFGVESGILGANSSTGAGYNFTEDVQYLIEVTQEESSLITLNILNKVDPTTGSLEIIYNNYADTYVVPGAGEYTLDTQEGDVEFIITSFGPDTVYVEVTGSNGSYNLNSIQGDNSGMVVHIASGFTWNVEFF